MKWKPCIAVTELECVDAAWLDGTECRCRLRQKVAISAAERVREREREGERGRERERERTERANERERETERARERQRVRLHGSAVLYTGPEGSERVQPNPHVARCGKGGD